MKIRRPDPEKARRQLERQHIAAAQRSAGVVRPRRAPAGFPAAVAPLSAAANFEAAMTQLATTAGVHASRIAEAFREAVL